MTVPFSPHLLQHLLFVDFFDDGYASPTQWTWVWINSRSWWWTRRPGVLQFMGSQRVGHDWATELNWTDSDRCEVIPHCSFDLHFSNNDRQAEEPEINLPTSAGSWKKQENSRKTFISALLTMPKPLTVWITINYGQFWKRWEYQTTWPTSWETYMQVRKQQLHLDMEQQTGSK